MKTNRGEGGEKEGKVRIADRKEQCLLHYHIVSQY